MFLLPLLCEEVDDGGVAGEEGGAVAPDAVGGVGFYYAERVSGIMVQR